MKNIKSENSVHIIAERQTNNIESQTEMFFLLFTVARTYSSSVDTTEATDRKETEMYLRCVTHCLG